MTRSLKQLMKERCRAGDYRNSKAKTPEKSYSKARDSNNTISEAATDNVLPYLRLLNYPQMIIAGRMNAICLSCKWNTHFESDHWTWCLGIEKCNLRRDKKFCGQRYVEARWQTKQRQGYKMPNCLLSKRKSQKKKSLNYS